MKVMKKKFDNDGFSLIEMIVSILITGIIMLGVGVFISTSRYTYTAVGISTKLQEESTAASNYISELLREAQDYGAQDVTVGAKTYKLLWIKTPPVEDADEADAVIAGGSVINFIVFDNSDPDGEGKLYYSRATVGVSSGYHINTSGAVHVIDNFTESDKTNYLSADPYRLLAECVKDISISSNYSSSLITVSVDYLYFNQDYKSNIVVKSRNK